MKTFLKIIILIFFCHLSYSQNSNFLATYQIKYKPINFDSVKVKNNSNQNFTDIEKQLIYESKTFNKINFILEFNKIQSKFYQLPMMKNDLQKMKLITVVFGINDQKYFANQKNVIVQKHSFGEDFLIKMPKINWTITNEKKVIGKYICFKATAIIEKENTNGKVNLNVIAWFTPELPFNFGPKNYVGLPGLIVSLNEGNSISYTIKKIDKKDYRFIKPPTKGKKITLKEFDYLSKKMFENLKN